MDAKESGTIWWVSWEEHDSPEDTRPIRTPPNKAIIAWWESGVSNNGAYATMVALVHASDKAAVRKAIETDWPSKDARVWRFRSIREERPLAIGDRFPLEPWSLARLSALGVEVIQAAGKAK